MRGIQLNPMRHQQIIPSANDPYRQAKSPALTLGKMAHAHEVLVDGAGGFAAFVDGPDDERLAAAEVAGGEHAFERSSYSWRRP